VNNELMELAEKPMKKCDTCKMIESILLTMYNDDDSHVIDTVVESIRDATNIKDFAKGATFSDNIKKAKCQYCESENTADVIYGYVDEDDKVQQKKEARGEIFLAGCVPDSYGINIDSNWYFPRKVCNECKRFFNYSEDLG
jgi:hypothetical protein